MTSAEQSNGVGRRSVARAAAWTIPAVSLVAAAPAFASSVILPPSTWYYAWISSECTCGEGDYELYGRNNAAQPAALPVGTTVLVTPAPGVTMQFLALVGGTYVNNPNGTATVTVNSNVSALQVYYKLTGPVGPGITFLATVPGLQPPTDTKTSQIVAG